METKIVSETLDANSILQQEDFNEDMNLLQHRDLVPSEAIFKHHPLSFFKFFTEF
jgi:hypothetical protein